MKQEELLLDATASYLTTLFAEAIEVQPQTLAPDAPFAELGVNSFHVLKITKELEGNFGALPKTLLFERFNVQELAAYFVEEHLNIVSDMFAGRLQSANVASAPVSNGPSEQQSQVQAPVQEQPQASIQQQSQTPVQVETPVSRVVESAWQVLVESELANFPQAQQQVEQLFSRFKNETSVSRGTKDIAPYLFLGSKGEGYFNFSLSKNILLVYAYTGSQEYLPELAGEIQQYCKLNELEFNLFSDTAVTEVAGTPFSATPFGVVQRVTNLQEFTLKGGSMRRLRYQVTKFEKAGEAETREYQCGSDPQLDKNIAEIIDLWCESRTMVNPLIYKVKAEILAGNLNKQHRLFVTFLNGTLQNVILISFMSQEQNGYLMDLEFYPKDMPLGGLEFAIVKMIEILVAEGCSLLSLGGTYGVKIEDSPNPDLALEKNLNELREMNVFNDAGNLQFKNKFRPENESIFLCRAVEGCNADNVIDIIMMIADPSKIAQLPEPKLPEQKQAEAESVQAPQVSAPSAPASTPVSNVAANVELPRLALLEQYNFNPLNLPANEVLFDLKTDSWAKLNMPVIAQQRSLLHSQLAVAGSAQAQLAELFPFAHFAIANSGSAAERAYCQAFEQQGGAASVPQSLLFPTWLFSLVEQGFEPVEMPCPNIYQLQQSGETAIDKAGIDLTALKEHLNKQPSSTAFVCMELNANASGGHACSLAHLQEVKQLTEKAGVPLVFDATRVLEHAYALKLRGECQGDIWDVAKQVLAVADVITMSLAKDFGFDAGGIVASNNEALINRVRANLLSNGAALDLIDSKMLALALKRKPNIASLVKARVEQAKSLSDTLVKQGLPVAHAGGNHCVLLDVKQMPAFSGLNAPVASFLAWLYLATGVRAGAHNVGMQKDTKLNQLVRLAVPLGMLPQQIDALAKRIAQSYQKLNNIPELTLASSHAAIAGEAFADYQLKELHNSGPAMFDHPTAVQSKAAAPTASVAPTATSASQDKPQAVSAPAKLTGASQSVVGDIAVIGMAGRYPDAQNMVDFWDNLTQGKDSIVEIPAERLKGRRVDSSYQNYRGGFIDDVDRFDSLFFNISPREAEYMDPQERIFLEVAWETLESAGYYPEIMADADGIRRVGVFVGAVWTMYQTLALDERLHGNDVITNSFLWSIPNRVSYNMNLTGPSIAVDTACSASLTALYLACESLRNRECDSAIVGGVNLDIHQAKFDMTWAGGALSPDGVCRTFGAGANGYVAGEGVGAILIKPLANALQDKDNVLGLIRSVAANHGGRTSGFQVPNPKAHSAVISEALQKAGVDANTVSYVEAHGTGTELGDPIEISGLNDAYKQYNVPKQSVAIGSVKTNIGHLEAAAGLVGVSKILLQMQHQQIVPSLHSTELNEHINFEQSPFVVQQELAPWQSKDGSPLRAGLSSFGAGGSNAHVIIEQYQDSANNQRDEQADQSCIIPLSAKTEKQVQQMAENLLGFLQSHEDANLADIAFTLQDGRKSFEHRLAIFVQDKMALVDRLEGYLRGDTHPDIMVGHVKNADNITTMLSQAEKQNFVTMLQGGGDNHRIARLWLDGLLQEAAQLTPALTSQLGAKRIALPTYPFADKRHWAAQMDTSAGSGLQKVATHGVTSRLHPLLDTNESTFQRQLFKKRFTEEEFFIYDHLVSDIPTLPGVAYLDMVRQAGELAAGMKVHQIRNIIWLSPLTVVDGVPNDVYVELIPKGDLVQFDVFSEKPEGGVQLYAQGKLQYKADAQDQEPPEDEYIDIEAIKSRCTPAIKGPKAYPIFKSLGLHLGHAFQVIQEVYKNDDEVLGHLTLQDIPDSSPEDYVLHPSLVDGSFQALMGAKLSGESTDGGMVVPYSLGIVEIRHPLTKVCYSYLTEADPEKKSAAGLSKKNCWIVDDTGRVLVKVYDSVGVALTDVHEKPEDEEGFETLFYNTQWLPELPQTVAENSTDEGALLLFANDKNLKDDYLSRTAANDAVKSACVLVLAGETFERIDDTTWQINANQKDDFKQLFDDVKAAGFDVNKVAYNWHEMVNFEDASQTHGELLGSSVGYAVYSFMYLTQTIITEKLESNLRLIYIHHSSTQAPQPQQEAIEGYMTILRAEAPKLACKMLNVPADECSDGLLLEAVQMEFNSVFDDKFLVQYENKERRIRQITNIALDEQIEQVKRENLPVRQQGVYLITGGTGGLGMIFAEYLAREYQARLVLTARSALKPEVEEQIAAMREQGAQVLFVQGDVSSQEGAEFAVAEAKREFGEIHGIIHSAGTLRDAMIRNKVADELDAVFAAKINGTLYLDKATSEENLDFFALFSSMAALVGNAGQSDYSYANRFMDRFSTVRNSWCHNGTRSGRTVSVNWSIWAEGGMQLDEQTAQFFKRSLGIKPLGSEVGVKSFFEGLHTNLDHFVVVEGEQEKIEIAWGLREPEPVPEAELADGGAGEGQAASSGASPESDELMLQVQEVLSEIVMDFLKLEPDETDIDTILVDLGFDSIGLSTFANEVNDKYGTDLTPVHFFEYPNIREIARYMSTESVDLVAKVHGGGASSASSAPAASGGSSEAAVAEQGGASFGHNKGWSPAPAQGADSSGSGGGGFNPQDRFNQLPIAIVGASGCMPQSDDIHEYWQKLRDAENNMVTVIPEDRWDWREYWGDPMEEENKTLSKWGGFMREVDKFDPLFWGISPREAAMMDPQQRVFLESVWAAIEDSGHKVSELAGTRTGLFVGAATRDYIDVMAALNVDLDGYSASGTSHAILANRVSFLLDIHGPSAPLDTACSSSSVALHRAIESIHTGSCDMAIVGGVQVMLTPAAHISFGMAGMLASDGKCKTFDSRADGYVRGEGSGAIIIKPLAVAQEQGDHIYAVVRATAENHGGKATMLTAPNPNAQADLLVEAYQKAGIDPTTVGLLECHGTGTSLGDPIEVQAMKKAFADLYKIHNKPNATTPHIGLTSAKTNIGHLETSAGIAGILKVLMAIKHKEIPALLHFEEQNPYIDLKGTPFYMVDKTRPWEPALDDKGNPVPRRAGVSSFGFGGANVHVVLEEYVSQSTDYQLPAGQPCVLVVSAKSEERLRVYAERLAAHLENHDDNLADFAYTLQVGRDAMDFRLTLTATSVEEAISKLSDFASGEQSDSKFARIPAKKARAKVNKDDLNEWLNNYEHQALCDAWLQGADIDWQQLYKGSSPSRISLPTYPFARERCWFDIPDESKAVVAGQAVAIHPLLHNNTSTLSQQCYSSAFSVTDTHVQSLWQLGQSGQNESSGIASSVNLTVSHCVEMLRVAFDDATRDEQQNTGALLIEDINWLQSSELSSNQQVHLALFEEDDDEIGFELFKEGPVDGNQSRVLMDGVMLADDADAPKALDITQLQSQFNQAGVEGSSLYQSWQQNGIEISPQQQSISRLWHTKQQCLVELELAELELANTSELLHWLPVSGVDSLWPVICHIWSAQQLSIQSLVTPVSAGQIVVYQPLSGQTYAWLRPSSQATQREAQGQCFDIDLVNAKGEVCMTLRSVCMPIVTPADTPVTDFASLLDKIYNDSAVQNDGEAATSAPSDQQFSELLNKIY